MARHVLIYDDKCSFCVWYSKALVNTKLLKQADVCGFNNAPAHILALIDFEHADIEVPLYDSVSNKIYYGADAIIELATSKLNLVKKIAKLAPINYVLHQAYKLVSYNRKGLLATKPNAGAYQCMNAYSYNYKKFFIVLCYLLSVIVINTLHAVNFPRASSWIIMLSGFVVLASVITSNKNYLELAMQWQLQLMIMCTVLIPFSLLLPYSGLGALIFLVITSVLFTQQIKRRSNYLWWYWQQEKG
jgi:predicted DCC family thiol-disulfide oxidoreductase YuxK